MTAVMFSSYVQSERRHYDVSVMLCFYTCGCDPCIRICGAFTVFKYWPRFDPALSMTLALQAYRWYLYLPTNMLQSDQYEIFKRRHTCGPCICQITRFDLISMKVPVQAYLWRCRAHSC